MTYRMRVRLSLVILYYRVFPTLPRTRPMNQAKLPHFLKNFVVLSKSRKNPAPFAVWTTSFA